METLAVVAVLVVLILAPLFVLAWYQRRASGRGMQAVDAGVAAPIAWGEVAAGDQIDCGDRTYVVRAVLDCRQERDHRVFGWRWFLTDEGGLVEYRASRLTAFSAPAVLEPDSAEYEDLTNPRGVLARFESGSRLSWDPAIFHWTDQRYEVTGTGTFYAWSDADLSAEPVWQAISRDPKENVLFALERLESTAGERPAGGDGMILGVWTDRVALFPCRELGPAASARISRPDPGNPARSP